ncbi:MAG TPA: hypothetical protein EYP14_07265, partial [Planctomycetaceae bacterium]|nr:hypothetical protein [Planctomycetaceae bacterium]
GKTHAGLLPIASTGTNGPASGHRLGVHVYLDSDPLPAGKTCRIAIVLDVEPGWHINANPVRPSFLIPTTVTLRSKHGTVFADLVYPEPDRLTVQGIEEPVLVYEGRIILSGRLRVPAEAASQVEELRFDVRYQACNDQMCEPPKMLSLEARVPVGPKDAPSRPINGPLFQERGN